jgi:hypothetical protein
MCIDSFDVMRTAADLMSSEGENHEYDRALVEMTTNLIGLSTDEDRATVERILRGMSQ